MADERALSPPLRHETDILILDYLIFNATETLLRVASRCVNGITTGNKSAAEGDIDELLLQLQLVECESINRRIIGMIASIFVLPVS